MRNSLMPTISVASLFAMIAVSSASAPAYAAPDMIFTNGNVITMEKAQPKAEAVAVEKTEENNVSQKIRSAASRRGAADLKK